MNCWAGVDEAGYGPRLGPLTVGLSWLPAPSEPDLWRALRKVVLRKPSRAAGSLAVCDSKLLYKPGRPPIPLELSALAFVRLACGRLPASLGELLALLGAAPPSTELPWYAAPLQLPRWTPSEQLAEAAEGLVSAWTRAGLAELSLALRVVRADAFNAGVRRWGNKAQLHLLGVLELLQRLPRPFTVTVDRLGGRKRYAPALAEAFGQLVRVGGETPDCSYYQLGSIGRARFEVKADRRHFLVALSSILAKYVRELHMASLNSYFQRRLKALRPTAGYPQDAARFLAEIADVLLDGERPSLVRGR